MAKRIEAATGIETRATILGHMQRGGSPTCKDRVYASMMGALAVDLLVAGKRSRVVGYRHGEFVVGGETAEHPGLMPDEEYDLAGFTVGIGEKDKLVSGENLKPGNVLIGVKSSGVHSNGFSLVRKVFNINENTINKKYELEKSFRRIA